MLYFLDQPSINNLREIFCCQSWDSGGHVGLHRIPTWRLHNTTSVNIDWCMHIDGRKIHGAYLRGKVFSKKYPEYQGKVRERQGLMYRSWEVICHIRNHKLSSMISQGTYELLQFLSCRSIATQLKKLGKLIYNAYSQVSVFHCLVCLLFSDIHLMYLLSCNFVMDNSHIQLSHFFCRAWKDSVSFVVLYKTEKISVYMKSRVFISLIMSCSLGCSG